MKFIKLTWPNGEDVWIQTQWIQMVCPPLSEDRGGGDGTINAVVVLSGHRLKVRETVAQVIALV